MTPSGSNNPNPICPNHRKNRSTQNPIPAKLAEVGKFVWQFKPEGVSGGTKNETKCMTPSGSNVYRPNNYL